MAFVSAYAVVCERVLTEKDEVASLIRVVEVFFVPPHAVEKPEQNAVLLTLFANLRFTNEDADPHSLHLQLVRPDGEKTIIPITDKLAVPEGRFPDIHRVVIAAGQIGIQPKQLGEHYFAVILDGAEVARVFVTLLPAPIPSVSVVPN